MLFSKHYLPFEACLSIVLFLSALPIVRADYFTAYHRLWSAFGKYTIQFPPSALSDDEGLIADENHLEGNLTLFDDAWARLDNGELTEEQAQNQATQAENAYIFTQYKLLSDFMGVGFNASCRTQISQVLKDANEWDKAGQQAASVIMALLPSLLTFGQSCYSFNVGWQHSHTIRQSLCTTEL